MSTESSAPSEDAQTATAAGDAAEAPGDWKEHQAKRRAAKRDGKGRWSQPVSLVLAAASVAVSIVLASLFVGLVENGNQLPQALRLAEVNAQNDVIRSQIALPHDDTATLVWSSSIQTAVLIVDDLDALDDQTYRVWYLAGDDATPVGGFDVTHDGSEVWAVLDGDVANARSLLVTVDEDDATTPSGEQVLEIPL